MSPPLYMALHIWTQWQAQFTCSAAPLKQRALSCKELVLHLRKCSRPSVKLAAHCALRSLHDYSARSASHSSSSGRIWPTAKQHMLKASGTQRDAGGTSAAGMNGLPCNIASHAFCGASEMTVWRLRKSAAEGCPLWGQTMSG